MAHVAGGDAVIACFDAKYHYWFWRPYRAIPQAADDGNPATVADSTWAPLGTTPNLPEYPLGHACHSPAVVTALPVGDAGDAGRPYVKCRSFDIVV